MSALPYTLVDQMPPQLGLVALQSDETIERDMRQLLPDSVELLVTRIPSAEDVTPETLAAMEPELSRAVSLFPRAASFSVVGYGCTSGTAQIGVDRITDLVRSKCNSRVVTQPVSALLAACEALQVRKLAFVSPYVASVSERLMNELESRGLDIPAFGSFDEQLEAQVVRIAPDSVSDGAMAVARKAKCDAIFLSCTNLRTLDLIEDIEDATGLPVLSSNLVLAWDMLRHTGLSARAEAPGRLFNADVLRTNGQSSDLSSAV
ncbi:Asp/Glu racemase [Gymnodinialimonas hymeniacidonis]|uniref:maleate cis-trans isomerase family protein n=1 Tax=Gymnodinialimonas hymeniacidonis TaxID=3126508 RepID=UPI0034C63AE2